MTHFIREYGEIYDALLFLSLYFNEPKSQESEHTTNQVYYSILERVHEGSCEIPDYLQPFCYGSVKDTFLYKITFEDRPYTQCSCKRLLQALRNKTFVQRKYVEHFLPNADAVSIRKMIQLEHPASIELLQKASLPTGTETLFLYTLIYFDTIIQTLCQTIEKLCQQVSDIQQEFLAKNPTIQETAFSSSTAEKLRVLADVDVSADLSVSISVLDVLHLSFSPFEPSAFLLGNAFEVVLDTRYKYATVTPFTFAQAIGNQTRYDIYKTLLENSPQSTAELCMQLHLSKNSITYNLNEMLSQGILLLDHVKGLSHYYRIDQEYIRFVAGLLTEAFGKTKKDKAKIK